MTKGKRYDEVFKQEAVAQVVERGRTVAQVANGLGVSSKSLYDWVNIYGPGSKEQEARRNLTAENVRLKRELKQARLERDILKEPTTAFFANESKSGTRS